MFNELGACTYYLRMQYIQGNNTYVVLVYKVGIPEKNYLSVCNEYPIFIYTRNL